MAQKHHFAIHHDAIDGTRRDTDGGVPATARHPKHQAPPASRLPIRRLQLGARLLLLGELEGVFHL
jgi:hypothetical protein